MPYLALRFLRRPLVVAPRHPIDSGRRRSRQPDEPFAVFVGVLAFGWLWGAVGLILGVPILMVVKTVCDRVEELKPVGEFLGA